MNPRHTLLLPLALACAQVHASDRLETLVVTASRQPVELRQVAASVSVMEHQAIELRGQANLADVMRAMPSVNVSGGGGAGKTASLRIRGEESFRTLVLIDGIDVSDTSSPQVSPRLEHIASAGIERVEVLRGPQGMMYGADAGGIVNITTRRAHEDGLAADFATEYGRYDSWNNTGNIRGKTGIADFSLTLSDFSTDGYNSRTTDTTLRDRDGYDNTTLHFNGGLQLTDHFRVELSARDVDASARFDGCFNSQTFVTTDNCVSDYVQRIGRLAAVFDNGELRQSLAFQRASSTREDIADGVRGGDNDAVVEELQYQGIARWQQAGDLVYGIDLEEQRYEGGGDPERERDQIGAYIEWQGKVAEQFFYTAGLRHDDNDDFGEYTSYRVSGAHLTPLAGGDVLKLKTSYGTGFRAPSLYEVAYNRGPFASPPASDISLDAEESKGFEAGVEYQWASGAWLDLVYFNQSIDNAIDFDLVGYSGYLQAGGTTRSKGVELNGELPVNRWLSVTGNYTYNDAKTPAGETRLRRPRHLMNLGAVVAPHRDVTLALNLKLVRDAEDQVGSQRVALDDYTNLDATLNWDVNAQLALYVRGENLLGDDYEEVASYRVPGAAFYTGLRLQF
ncbi:MAG: TonB-dependent receptor [Spongiibacteraceae bacterium]|jgi:vitamin B12 transporter|nr:TonB-dependent receptor [Spongiibacteraceae bacterium]